MAQTSARGFPHGGGPPAGADGRTRAEGPGGYNPAMNDTPVFGRLRAMTMLILATAAWSIATSHATVHGSHFWIALALAAGWATVLFTAAGGPRRVWSSAVGFGLGIAATWTDPAFGVLLLISVGAVGARMSWRAIRRYGAAVVVLASIVLVAATGVSPPTYHLVLSRRFLNLVITFVLILLFGRLIADNAEVRAAQTRSLDDLRAAHAELQRRASAMEEVAMLRERTRLSRELHDTLGHALSAITVQLEAVRRLLPTDSAMAERVLGETQVAARGAMRDLRLHLSALRDPPAPVDLADALRQLCAEAATRNGWDATIELEPVEHGDAQRRVLLQVAREALQNCERHAQAGSLHVRLVGGPSQVSLTIQDDGRGFDLQAVGADRFGLQGMRERLGELGGQLRIESRPGHGTRIVGVVPAAGGR